MLPETRWLVTTFNLHCENLYGKIVPWGSRLKVVLAPTALCICKRFFVEVTMAYPPTGFDWGWTDLSATASLSDVISTVNWIGKNLNGNYTNWITANNTDLYNNIETAKNSASSAASAAVQAAADAAQAAADAAAARQKISRCSYLRGTR